MPLQNLSTYGGRPFRKLRQLPRRKTIAVGQFAVTNQFDYQSRCCLGSEPKYRTGPTVVVQDTLISFRQSSKDLQSIVMRTVGKRY